MTTLLLAGLMGVIAWAGEAEGGLRAGAATSNITPEIGSSLNGGHGDRAATTIHDDLFARCLVLDDGETKLAFAICDSCAIPCAVVLDAKARIQERLGIPPSHVLISATHSHSCPTATGAFQSDVVPGYPEFLAKRIADGVTRASFHLEPARIGWSFGSNQRQVFNRRWYMKTGTIPPDPFGNATDQVRMNPPVGSPDLVEPAGPTDPTVAILSVEASDGRPIALLANYSLHYVGDTGPGHVSADYFGAFADMIQQRLDADRQEPPFVGIMSNGTSGDINNINFLGGQPTPPTYGKIRAVAMDLANEAMRVESSMEYKDQVKLGARTAELDLGVRKPTADEVNRAKASIAGKEGSPLGNLPEIYARESVLLAEYPDEVPVTLQVLSIGDLRIGAIPCEVFVEIGQSLREKAGHPYFTVSLANGYNGYLPSRRHHELGGYETWRARSSYLEPGAAEKIEAKLLEMINLD
jgi:hypothetical protein